MNQYNSGNPGFGLYQSQPGISHGMGNTIVDGHRPVTSTTSDTRSPPIVCNGVPRAITPAQAYARSVKTGEPHDRTLYHTIERKRSEKTEPQPTPLHLSNPGVGRGVSFAQHLYASAVKNKSGSSVPVLGHIPILPSNEPATSLSSFSSKGASQGSRSIPNRNTSLLPSLLDSSPQVQFSPSDLYSSSVARHGLASRNYTMPESSSARPSSMMTALSRGSYNQLQHDITHPETQNSRQVSYQPQIQPPLPPALELQANRLSTINPPSLIEAPPDVIHFLSSANAGDVVFPSPPPSFVEQSVDIPRGSSPPPFEENERPTIPAEVIVADVPSVTLTHQESQLDGSLVPPSDITHEAVPTYTLIDEEQPPPAFDDLHPTNNTETAAKIAPVPQPELLPVLSKVVTTPSSSSSLPAPPPPFVSNSSAYMREKAPAYAPLDLDGASSFVGTSQSARQDTTTKFPSIATARTSNLHRPDPPSMFSINSQMLCQSPPMSPLTSPVNAPPLYGTAFSSGRPSVPSSPRPASVLSARSMDSQSTRVSYDPLTLPSNANSMSPPVMYHNNSTAPQARQSIMPTATQSVVRPLGTQQPPIVDALTHSMSGLMEGSLPSDTRSLAYENGSSTRQSALGPLGSQQAIPAFYPPSAPQTMDSLNREIYSPGADHLLQEAYQLPTGSDAEARYGTQGSGSLSEFHQGHPGFNQTNDPHTMINTPTSFSSQHSPSTVPHLGPVPPRFSQEGPQTESVRAAEVGSTSTQLGGTAAPSRLPYSDRPHNASVPLPPSLQSPYHSFNNRDVYGPVATPGLVPFQSQNVHPQSHSPVANLNPMQRGGHGLPPPLPPPIVVQPSRAFQTPQASQYSQDSAKYQVGPSTGAPVLNSNDLARKFAYDALMAPAGPPTYTFLGTNQR